MIRRIERVDGARFQVYGRRNGKHVYVGTYESRRDALAADEDHRVTQRKVEAGELPPEHDTKIVLNDALDKWLEALDKGKSRSHRAYSEFVKYQIKPWLGTTPIASLRKPHVMRWQTDLLAKYSASSINSALGCLSSAFAWFVDQEWVPSNPCNGVALLEIKDQTFNWIKTRGELERLLSVCPDELRDMIAVAVGTGLRLDELLHLQHDDFDLDARLITVSRGRQGTTKSGKVRHVPILDSVLPVLRQRSLKRAGATLVWPGRKGKVRTKTPVQCAFKAALKRAGLDTTLSWHDLRHTCASWWVIGGGDIFRLSKLLGHGDVRVTQKTYAHLAPEAWTQDYSRLAFHCPSEPAKVYEFVRDEDGKLMGKRALAAVG
jgi:integrase